MERWGGVSEADVRQQPVFCRRHHVMNDAEVHACRMAHDELRQWPVLFSRLEFQVVANT